MEKLTNGSWVTLTPDINYVSEGDIVGLWHDNTLMTWININLSFLSHEELFRDIHNDITM